MQEEEEEEEEDAIHFVDINNAHILSQKEVGSSSCLRWHCCKNP